MLRGKPLRMVPLPRSATLRYATRGRMKQVLARGGLGGEDRARNRVGYGAGEDLGDAAVTPVVHMEVVRRDEGLEGNAGGLPPVLHHGIAVK
jgi:hypothetical protein